MSNKMEKNEKKRKREREREEIEIKKNMEKGYEGNWQKVKNGSICSNNKLSELPSLSLSPNTLREKKF